MPGPLHGYRIVDLTSNVAGPLGTMILGDQGADVIKVEAPDGDSTRSGANRRGGLSGGVLNNNRHKRTVTLDLKNPAAAEAVEGVAAGGAGSARRLTRGAVVPARGSERARLP